MRTRPTPGPWHYETNAQGNVVIWATRNGDDDKHILGVSQFGSLEQREANARFICAAANKPVLCDWCANPLIAAPDLYAALERVWDAYGFDPSIDSSIWQEVQTALAKARGDQSHINTHPGR